MLPAGGSRGFGIALIVELLAAALTGAQLGPVAAPFGGDGPPPGVGQFFLAIDPARFSGGAYPARIAALVHSISGQPGARLPGARRQAARAAADRNGVAVDAALLAEVRRLAGRS